MRRTLVIGIFISIWIGILSLPGCTGKTLLGKGVQLVIPGSQVLGLELEEDGINIQVVVDRARIILKNKTADAGIMNFRINNHYIVFVSREFVDLPKRLQKAILYHELGHIVLGHIRYGRYVRLLSNEIQADRYSAKYNHEDILEALNLIVKQAEKLKVPKTNSALIELLERIEVLKRDR